MPDALRPTFELHSPWWESGIAADPDGDFTVGTMVAAVLADNEAGARARIVSAYDTPPDTIEWRWDPEPLDRSPFTDRFPQADWMTWDLRAGVTCVCDACSAAVKIAQGEQPSDPAAG